MPTVNIRSVPEEVRSRFNAGATLRGLTLAQYLEKLIELHDEMRKFADAGDLTDSTLFASAALHVHGLQSVHREA